MKYILPIVILFGATSPISSMNFTQVREHVKQLSDQEINNCLLLTCHGKPALLNKIVNLIYRFREGVVNEQKYIKEQALLRQEVLRPRSASTGNLKKLPF